MIDYNRIRSRRRTAATHTKTHKYRDRFGRDKIDEDMLRVVAACEVLG